MDELDFDLPEALVAQTPSARRDDARLLVLERESGSVGHRGVLDLPELLDPGDLLVVNDTRVLPARLLGRRETGGRVELLLLAPRADGAWEALVRCGGSLRGGEVVRIADGSGVALRRPLGEGRWLVAGAGAPIPHLMAAHGRMPLPPYIRRAPDDERDDLDRERYQTVYARADGAVAAPTAGLHLTPALLERLEARGVRRAAVTLHVGLGTFAPVRCERLEDHPMHAETYVIPPEAAAAVRETRAAGGRIVAVGTTTVRTLEASARGSEDGLPVAGAAATDLLIAPGHAFRAVDALLTNFHLPRSTLLALVGACAGLEHVLAAYAEAVGERYRFFSYGDAMLIR